MIKQLLLVGLGGGIGSVLRAMIYKIYGTTHFPYATLTVNIIGSFAIGILAAFFLKQQQQTDAARLFFITGICGGFTTFSAFSLENMELLQAGRYKMALFYILSGVLTGIVATFAGFKLIQ